MSLWSLTGGRPMRRIESLFMDHVAGELVCLWRDRLGRHWMAVGPWSLFRISKDPS